MTWGSSLCYFLTQKDHCSHKNPATEFLKELLKIQQSYPDELLQGDSFYSVRTHYSAGVTAVENAGTNPLPSDIQGIALQTYSGDGLGYLKAALCSQTKLL